MGEEGNCVGVDEDGKDVDRSNNKHIKHKENQISHCLKEELQIWEGRKLK